MSKAENGLDDRTSELEEMETAPLSGSDTVPVKKRKRGEKRWSEMTPQEKRKEVLSLIVALLLTVLLSFFLQAFVIQRNTVRGSSMFPTLKEGDELVVEKLSRYVGRIRRGDIITVNTDVVEEDSKHNHIIKRVIGVPGDTIELRDEHVYLNGELLEEPYLPSNVLTHWQNPDFVRVELGAEQYFVMGDNRDFSHDSRAFGPIRRQDILGHLCLRVYPFEQFGIPD